MTTIDGKIPLNAFLNAASTVVNALAGFLTLPFLIDRLGATGYGLWVLVGVVAGLFLFFDVGFTGAVGRLVAGMRRLEDVSAINAVMSTALAASLPICVLIIVAASLVWAPFLLIFEVPPAQVSDVRLALLIAGITAALSVLESIFYGFLWGYERFDLQNFIEIPMVVLRTASIFLLITDRSTLADLALIIAGANFIGFTARVMFCYGAEPRLAISLRSYNGRIAHDMLDYGGWFGLLSLSRSRLQNIPSFIIGHLLGAVAVTTFTIPRLMTSYANLIVLSSTQSVAPRAAAFHFGGEHEKQQKLFLVGGRYSLAMSLFFLGGFVLFGLPFLALWQGGDRHQEYLILLILTMGETVPLSQWITYSAVVGTGAHRRLALLALVEGAAVLILSYGLGSVFGLIGVAVAVAACGLAFRGALQWIYGCRLVGVPLMNCATEVFLPVTLIATFPLTLFLAIRLLFTPTSWIELFLSAGLYSVAYWASLSVALLGMKGTRSLMRSAFRS